jgi:TfoX/Sxy family transcriptional regulator of competence genes
MAYDEKLAERVRKLLARREGVVEKKMFGGLAFMLKEKMFCGVLKEDLVVRVGPGKYEVALARPHVQPMDFTGRPIKGFVFVGPGGCRTDNALKKWVTQAAEYVLSLPKAAKPSGKKRRV